MCSRNARTGGIEKTPAPWVMCALKIELKFGDDGGGAVGVGVDGDAGIFRT